MEITIKKVAINQEDGGTCTKNFFLDNTIELFKKYKDSENVDELIKELVVHQIEGNRRLMSQLIFKGGQTLQSMKAYAIELDATLCDRIEELQETPVIRKTLTDFNKV